MPNNMDMVGNLSAWQTYLYSNELLYCCNSSSTQREQASAINNMDMGKNVSTW